MTAECLAEMGTFTASHLYHIDDSKDNDITMTFSDCHFTEQKLYGRKFHHFNIMQKIVKRDHMANPRSQGAKDGY